MIVIRSHLKHDINVKLFLVLGAGAFYECLQYINDDEIKEAIPPIGLRVLFRFRLTGWKKAKVRNTDILS